MDPLLIAVIALGTLLLLTVLLLTGARRGRRTARRSLSGAQTDLASTRQSLQSVKLGEREAAWAADRSSRRLERLTLDLTKADHEAARREAALDDLRSRLGAADRDLDRLRGEYDVAEVRIGELEGELSVLRLGSADETERIAGLELRLTSVVRERDRLQAATLRSQQLEDELAALGRVHQELSALREENASLRAGIAAPASDLTVEQGHLDDLRSDLAALQGQLTRDRTAADLRIAAAEADAAGARQRLTDLQSGLPDRGDGPEALAHQAAITDLEEKLAAVSAARTAEQQRSGQRIASLERLHVDLAERDRQIARLEAEIASLGVPPESIQTSAALTKVGSSEAPSYAMWDETLRNRVGTAVAEATERLEAEVAHLRLVISEKERLLAARGVPAAAVKPKGPLPITAISGIGPVIARILASEGITTIEDVAALTNLEIDGLSDQMPVYPDRIRADDWVGQARALLS